MLKVKALNTQKQTIFYSIFNGVRRSYKGFIARKISTMTRYFDEVIFLESRSDENLDLAHLIDSENKKFLSRNEYIQYFSAQNSKESTLARRAAVVLNGNFNHSFDIQETLTGLYENTARGSRLIVILYNPYYKWLFELASFLGLRDVKDVPETFITKNDLLGLCKLSGFDLVQLRPLVLFPFSFFGIGYLINNIITALPFIQRLSFNFIAVLKPIKKLTQLPSLSIVIPARNEMGNIENAIKRMPKLCDYQEIIFVEGHSSDDTWSEIQRIIALYENSEFKLSAYRQTGKGKADAVRLGFSKASGDLLTIIDADLTMPPEKLGLFYNAFCEGHAGFINGSRLLYPMEGGAMRFLNRLGNIFFAKALSFVLSTPLSDSLCGTKLMLKSDYERFIKWRNDFGDFDPFGDFEIIFPAAVLGLGIVDIPIRYGARTYGETNISRFSHGLMLLKMTWIGFWKVKLS